MINYKYLLKIEICFFPRKEWFMWNLWFYLKKGKETWWYGMEERYIESLQLSFKDEKYLKKQLCLCTMIDMGEIGCFNRNQLENI